MEDFYESDFHKKSSEEHLQFMLTFVQEHETTLQNVLTNTSNTISKLSESYYFPVSITPPAHLERVYPQDLIPLPLNATKNEQNIKKILVVLIFLSDEIIELKSIAEDTFFKPLIMFGQNPPDKNTGITNNNNYAINERELMLAKILPLLQECCNFIIRCNKILVNFIQQLAILTLNSNKISRNLFISTHFTSLFHSLGELLNILVIFDLIIQQNDVLLDSWSYYKTMLAGISTDPTNYDTTSDNIEKYEKLIRNLDTFLFSGDIFKNCIEQNFEILDNTSVVTPSVISPSGKFQSISTNNNLINIRNNQSFLTELLNYIKTNIESNITLINNNNEYYTKNEIISSLSLFILYRYLLPSNIPPDQKLYKNIWNLQKIIPCVVIYDKVIWMLGEFLSAFVAGKFVHAFIVVHSLI